MASQGPEVRRRGEDAIAVATAAPAADLARAVLLATAEALGLLDANVRRDDRRVSRVNEEVYRRCA